jgi:hypothetical protein
MLPQDLVVMVKQNETDLTSPTSAQVRGASPFTPFIRSRLGKPMPEALATGAAATGARATGARATGAGPAEQAKGAHLATQQVPQGSAGVGRGGAAPL